MRTGWILVLAIGCGGGGKQLPREGLTDPGELIFNGYSKREVKCFECHGGDGGGTKWGPALATRVPKLTDEGIRRTILGGHGKMPAFRDKLTDDEVGQLVPWLRGRFASR